MKTYAKLTSIWVTMTVVFITVFLVAGAVIAQTGAPLKAALVFPAGEDKVYNLDDPGDAISFDLLLANVSGSDVWTQEGFDNLGFHFYLFLYGPIGKDARIITSASGQIGGSPTPPVAPEKVAVEELNSKMPPAMPLPWAKKINIPELRDYYNVTLPGEYKLWFAMSFVQYDTANLEAVDENNDGIVDRYYVPFNDRIWSDVIEFKEEYITLTTNAEEAAIKSDVRVTVTEYIFGEGSHPGVTKKPLVDTDFKLRLFSRSACEAKYSPINHKTCGAITNDWELRSGALTAELVDAVNGEYLFRDVNQDDWVIIGHATALTDYKHLWKLIDADDDRWGGEISVKLKLMTDSRGKKVPGKSKRLTGSELLIIEPEYVEWTSDQELYPFAFESIGDWGVEVAVEPPEGFVTDNHNLSESVASELKALQFTITDVGSKYEATEVKYKLKHKKKTTNLKSKVYIKLSRKLAKEKKVPVWGEDEEKIRSPKTK